MREYGKITPGFWVGNTGRLLRSDTNAQLLALYLMTSPHANMIGLFYCPMAYIVADTGIPLEGALKALQRLSEVGFCTLESPPDWVWVHEMARYQIGDAIKPRDNQVKGIKKELEKIPNIGIKKSFTERYRDAFHLHDLIPPSPLQGPCKPLRSQEQEQEQEQEIKKQSPDGDCVETAVSTPAPSGKIVQIDRTPYAAILDCYHDILPELRAVRKLTPARQQAIRNAWRGDLIGADLSKWQDFFSYVRARCPFLTGHKPGADGRAFQCDLEWLMKPANLVKVIEGKYEEGARHG